MKYILILLAFFYLNLNALSFMESSEVNVLYKLYAKGYIGFRSDERELLKSDKRITPHGYALLMGRFLLDYCKNIENIKELSVSDNFKYDILASIDKIYPYIRMLFFLEIDDINKAIRNLKYSVSLFEYKYDSYINNINIIDRYILSGIKEFYNHNIHSASIRFKKAYDIALNDKNTLDKIIFWIIRCTILFNNPSDTIFWIKEFKKHGYFPILKSYGVRDINKSIDEAEKFAVKYKDNWLYYWVAILYRYNTHNFKKAKQYFDKVPITN